MQHLDSKDGEVIDVDASGSQHVEKPPIPALQPLPTLTTALGAYDSESSELDEGGNQSRSHSEEEDNDSDTGKEDARPMTAEKTTRPVERTPPRRTSEESGKFRRITGKSSGSLRPKPDASWRSDLPSDADNTAAASSPTVPAATPPRKKKQA